MSDGVRALTALEISAPMSWSLYAPVMLLGGMVAVALMEDACAFSGLPFWAVAVAVLAAVVPVLAAVVPVLAAAVPALAAVVPVLVVLDCSGYTALLSRKPATINRTYSSRLCLVIVITINNRGALILFPMAFITSCLPFSFFPFV